MGFGYLGESSSGAAPGYLGGADAPAAPRPNFLQRNPALITSLASALLQGPTLGRGLSNFGQLVPAAVSADRSRRAFNNWFKAKNGTGALAPEDIQFFSENPALAEKYAISTMVPKERWRPLIGPERQSKYNIPVNDTRPYQVNELTNEIKSEGGAPVRDTSSIFDGTSIDAQDSNILLTGDPASPEYAMAYTRQYLTPKLIQGTDASGNLTTTPMMPAVPTGIRKPTGATTSSPAPAPGPSPSLTVTPPAAPPSASPAPSPDGPTVGTPIVTGVKPPTEAQLRNRELYASTLPDLKIAEENFDATKNFWDQSLNALAPDFLKSAVTSGKYQQAVNSIAVIYSNWLYSTSGANVTPAEAKRQAGFLMPAIGDKAATIQDKRDRIRRMVEAIRTGGEANPTNAPMPPPSAPASGETAPVAPSPEDPFGWRT